MLIDQVDWCIFHSRFVDVKTGGGGGVVPACDSVAVFPIYPDLVKRKFNLELRTVLRTSSPISTELNGHPVTSRFEYSCVQSAKFKQNGLSKKNLSDIRSSG